AGARPGPRGSRPDGGRRQALASLCGLARRTGLRPEHRGPAARQPAVVLPLPAAAGGRHVRPRRRPAQPETTPPAPPAPARAGRGRVEDVGRLLDAVPTDTPLGVRDRAMFETLYGGGLRVGELVGLNVDDLDPGQSLVRVRGKGRRERLCPVGPLATAWVERW